MPHFAAIISGMPKTPKPDELHWKLEKKTLPLRFLWRISRGSLDCKESYFLTLDDGTKSAMGEIAPNTRYNNTPEVIEAQFATFEKAASAKALSSMTLVEFNSWLNELNLCNALRFGIESAWVHLQSEKLGVAVNRFLKLPAATQIATSFSVPIMDESELEAFMRPLGRFPSLKIKVDAETGKDTIDAVARLSNQKLRIDANESWTDPSDFMRFVESLKGKNIEFVEQPLPSSMKEAYREILPRMPFPLIADESIENTADFDELKSLFSGVNVKLMKSGGYLTAIDLLRKARAHGMRTMLGCMVETSLGIASAMSLCSLVDYADLDGFLLIKDDPFGFVRETDGILTFSESWKRGTR